MVAKGGQILLGQKGQSRVAFPLGVPITFVPLYYLIELVTRDKLHDLGKYKLALIHNPDAFGEQQD